MPFARKTRTEPTTKKRFPLSNFLYTLGYEYPSEILQFIDVVFVVIKGQFVDLGMVIISLLLYNYFQSLTESCTFLGRHEKYLSEGLVRYIFFKAKM